MNDIMAYTRLNLTTPCAVTGLKGMPFFNRAMKELLNLPESIDIIEMPMSLELFLVQEEKAISLYTSFERFLSSILRTP